MKFLSKNIVRYIPGSEARHIENQERGVAHGEAEKLILKVEITGIACFVGALNSKTS